MSVTELTGYIQCGTQDLGGKPLHTCRVRVVPCKRAKSGWSVLDCGRRYAVSAGMNNGQLWEFVRFDGERHRITVEWGDHRPASAPRDSTNNSATAIEGTITRSNTSPA